MTVSFQNDKGLYSSQRVDSPSGSVTTDEGRPGLSLTDECLTDLSSTNEGLHVHRSDVFDIFERDGSCYGCFQKDEDLTGSS